jgi:hypothetical protein
MTWADSKLKERLVGSRGWAVDGVAVEIMCRIYFTEEEIEVLRVDRNGDPLWERRVQRGELDRELWIAFCMFPLLSSEVYVNMNAFPVEKVVVE